MEENSKGGNHEGNTESKDKDKADNQGDKYNIAVQGGS